MRSLSIKASLVAANDKGHEDVEASRRITVLISKL